jgi:hypothetical protein
VEFPGIIMKKYLFLILFFAVRINAQDQNVNEKVNSFFEYLKPFTENEDITNNIPNLGDKEIKHFIKLEYEAYENSNENVYHKCSEQVRELAKGKKGIHYGDILYAFHSIIEKKYSVNFRHFLRIPYLLKAQVSSIKDSIYYDNNPDMPFSMFIKVIEFKVDEVLKGAGKFQAGNTYKCSWGSSWRDNSEEFIIGKTYLLPLELRGPEGNENILTLITYLDDNHGLYKVQDGKLIDKYNFFSFGDIISWNDFIQMFNKKVELIKKEE